MSTTEHEWHTVLRIFMGRRGRMDTARRNLLVEGENLNEELLFPILEVNPVVGVLIGTPQFHVYMGGDMSEGSEHVVLIVMWGVEDDGTLYWIIRNSQGTAWGDYGYVKILRQCDSTTKISIFKEFIYPI
ncbi:hypothetical protein OROMI_028077 [Orobanche minor]